MRVISKEHAEECLIDSAITQAEQRGELSKKFNRTSVDDKEYRKTINYEEVSELKNYSPCPFYGAGSSNAVCRSSGVAEWISSSEDTKYYCRWYYTECLRYMKAIGIEDEEYKQLNEEYFKELFEEDYIAPDQKFLIKRRRGDKDNGARKFKIRGVSTLAEFRIHPVK